MSGKVFQPLELKSKKTLAIWDDVEKRYINIGDQVPFSTGAVKFDAYIRVPENEKTRFTLRIGFDRRVLCEGEECTFDFPKTADEMLIKIQDKTDSPLEWTYSVHRDGFGIDTKYTILREEKVGAIAPAQSQIENLDPTADEVKVVNQFRRVASERNRDLDDGFIRNTILNGLIENGVRKEVAELAVKQKLTL